MPKSINDRLSQLTPDFRKQLETLLANCESRGIEMIPYFTLRDVRTQAKLYRQSRSFEEIKKAHEFLLSVGAEYLANVLMEVGAQNGKWATNALPGFSWHQHKLAVDCYWKLNDRANWSVSFKNSNGLNGYQVYAEEAKKLGLVSGYYWRHKDSVHVQQPCTSVKNLIRKGELTYKELDFKMFILFG